MRPNTYFLGVFIFIAVLLIYFYTSIIKIRKFNIVLVTYSSKYVFKRNYLNSKQLIFTLAYGYSKNKINIFVNSLRHTDYDGEVIMFVKEDIDSNTVKYLKKNNINIIFLSEEWPYFSPKNTLFTISEKILRLFIPKQTIIGYFKFASLRHCLILAYLMEYGNRYDHVLVIDSRDAYFQFNPFSWNLQDGVSFVEESRERKIADQGNNNEWVKNLNFSYDKVRSNYIINGGALFFSVQAGIGFYKEYLNFLRISEINNPIDQAIFNIMIYDGLYSGKINIYKNSNSPVRTLGLEMMVKNTIMNFFFGSSKLNWKNNLLYNEDGSVPVIVHQYDRIKNRKFKKFLDSKYNY